MRLIACLGSIAVLALAAGCCCHGKAACCTTGDASFSASWQTGHWVGTEPGTTSEEIWTTYTGGAMMGSYRLVIDDKPVLYEFIRLTSESNQLVMEITHFNGDGAQWPNQPVVFRSTAVGDGRIEYEQVGVPGKTLIYEHPSANVMRAMLNDPEDASPSVYEFHRAACN